VTTKQRNLQQKKHSPESVDVPYKGSVSLASLNWDENNFAGQYQVIRSSQYGLIKSLQPADESKPLSFWNIFYSNQHLELPCSRWQTDGDLKEQCAVFAYAEQHGDSPWARQTLLLQRRRLDDGNFHSYAHRHSTHLEKPHFFPFILIAPKTAHCGGVFCSLVSGGGR
jgi:hypothetical protein